VTSQASDSIRFTSTHEYVYPQGGGRVLIGLHPTIAEELGDINYVELMDVGETLSAGDTFATIGANRGDIELTMPVSGTLLSFNEEIQDRPNLMANDNYDVNWLLEVEMSDESELNDLITMDEAS
jgi:glycine cleavage system H protein